MSAQERPRGRSKTIAHIKPLGVHLGAYRWRRHTPGGSARGIIFRVGPLGHFQIQWFVENMGGGRRLNRSVKLSFWGVSGRRAKHAIYIGVHW